MKIINKICNTCHVEFPSTLEYFHKHTMTRDKLRTSCKSCTNKANAAYQKANPEKIKAKNDAWVKANPERHRANQLAWSRANPEKKYAWRKANPEKNKAAIAKWKKANPDKIRETRRKKVAKDKGVYHQDWTEKQLFETYGTNCYLCNKPIDFDAPKKGPGSDYSSWPDHITPTSRGGENTIKNVMPCHAVCNRSKHDKTYEEYMLTVNSQEIVIQKLS
jgi:5-methylcytosine-specific restriction endonuclease McrA